MRVWSLEFEVQGSGCRAQGSIFSVWRLGFRVQRFRGLRLRLRV